MEGIRLQYPIPLMCRVFRVSASGYYSWLSRPLSKRAQEEGRLEVEIRAAHKRTRETCGTERLQQDMSDHGVKVGICRIRRIRKKLGIFCKQKRKFKATTNSKHKLPVAENLLEQKFVATAPNKVWVTDITYIPTDEGWLYLAGHKDIFNGEIVGYAMDASMTKELVNKSLLRAVAGKRPSTGLIHHSDRGSQYCSYEYRELLDHLGMRASMSRKGNCYYNAPMGVSGERSRTSLSITAVTQAGERQYRRSLNTSRFSTTGNGDRRDWGIYPQQSMNNSFMKGNVQHESFRVHY